MKLKTTNKAIPKSECIISTRIYHYKDRKIEIGYSKKDKFLAVFVDDIWLTGTTTELPFDEKDTEKMKELSYVLTELLRMSRIIIDKAVDNEKKT